MTPMGYIEDGGAGLSYTNGIGSPQQVIGAADLSASSSTGRTAKSASDSLSLPSQNGTGNSALNDQATLSSTAAAFTQALSGSDVRADKVASLQQSIAAGTYSIPSSDVAAKVLNALLN